MCIRDRSSFFHSRHVSGILDDKIFDGLGRLLLGIADLDIDGIEPVSYTHLDVYKRQVFGYNLLHC